MKSLTYASKSELINRLTKIDREIEGRQNGMSFREMCNELKKLEVITLVEFDWLISQYQAIRTPFQHGISGRIVDPDNQAEAMLADTSSETAMFLARIFVSAPDSRAHDLEDYVYREAITVLEGVVNFLAAHPVPSSRY